MKRQILIVGQGNIGTFLGVAFRQCADFTVLHLVRNKSQKPGKVNLNFTDRRNTDKKIRKKSFYEYPQVEDYNEIKKADYIFVPVRHTQWKNAIENISPYLQTGQTLVLCGNMLDDFDWFEKNIPCPYVFVFPNFGGAVIENTLQGWLTANITTGVTNPSFYNRLMEINDLLKQVGFRPKTASDIKGWLMTHFAYNAGMLAVAAKLEGFGKMTRSFSGLAQMHSLMRECVDVIREYGIETDAFSDGKAVRQPIWWNTIKTYLLYLIPGLSKSADAAKNLDEWLGYIKSLHEFAKKYKLKTPNYEHIHYKKSLWIKWTVYCALGELSGIGIAGAIAFAVNAEFGEPETPFAKLAVLSIMLVAGFIEGFLLGTFQWNALKDKFSNMPKKEWVFYTVLVAVLGWFLGMLPSLFFVSGNGNGSAGSTGIDFDNPMVFAVLSIGSGMVLGAIFGLFQWFVLRKYAENANQWIVANALGWGLGLGWIYLFASVPTEKTSLTFNILAGIAGGLLAGFSVGAVTGIYLIKLKAKLKMASATGGLA